MGDTMKAGFKKVKIRPYFTSLTLAWSLVVIVLIIIGLFYIKEENMERARDEARSNFKKDQALRLWIASHGGIYVPRTQKTPGNKYLSNVSERDISTSSGRQLTLMNPAYAMRQIADMYYEKAGVKAHITGLKYFRPETAPDGWEKAALHSFNKGADEACEITDIDRQPFMRLMRPMFTEENCLKCHGHQGYKIGDVRGGVSVAVSMQPYLDNTKEDQFLLLSFLLILWGFGFSGLYFVSKKMKLNIREQNQLAEELQDTHKKLKLTNEILREKNKDLTRTEKELLTSKNHLIGVFDGISDPLLLIDRDLKIIRFNIAAKEYFGIKDSSEAIGFTCYKGLLGKNRVCEDCPVPEMVSGRQSRNFEHKCYTNPDRFEHFFLYPVIDKGGNFEHTVMRIHDITESKNLEKQLIQSEKLASIGVLVSGIAHEINNPNNFVTFNIPILRDYLNVVMPVVDEYAKKNPDLEMFYMPYKEFREDVFKLLDNVEHGSKRIKTIVDDLKEFSRTKHEKKTEKVSLKPVIEKVVSFTRSRLKRSVKNFEVNVTEDLPKLFIDPQHLEQVLVNLLINAYQAFDSPDEVNSRIDLNVSMNDSQDTLIVEVKDNGCGMDEQTLSKIFDPFFTTKPSEEGTGLGLYISHTLVENMGGRIEIESTPGKGSRFTVILGNVREG
jgi:signal transduction histidine kinase